MYELDRAIDIATHGMAFDELYHSSMCSHLRQHCYQYQGVFDFDKLDPRDVDWGIVDTVRVIIELFHNKETYKMWARELIDVDLVENPVSIKLDGDTFTLDETVELLKIYDDLFDHRFLMRGDKVMFWEDPEVRANFNWHESMK